MNSNYKTIRVTRRKVKLALFAIVAATSVLSLCLMALPTRAENPATQKKKPNILIIWGDENFESE
jgi:hypothetical protein